MELIPRDVWIHIILPQMSCASILALRFVCRHFHTLTAGAILNLKGNIISQLCESVVKQNSLSLLGWVFATLRLSKETVLQFAEMAHQYLVAAANDSIKILEKVLSLGIRLEDSVSLFFPIATKKRTSEEIIVRMNWSLPLWKAAARSSAMRMLHWLYQHAPIDIKQFESAIADEGAKSGNVAVIEWLRSKKIGFSSNNALHALHLGHFDAVIYFIEEGILHLGLAPLLLPTAISSGSRQLITWLLSREPLTYDAFGAAARRGDVELLRVLFGLVTRPGALSASQFRYVLPRVKHIDVMEEFAKHFGAASIAAIAFPTVMEDAPMDVVLWCIEKATITLSDKDTSIALQKQRFDLLEEFIRRGVVIPQEKFITAFKHGVSLHPESYEWAHSKGWIQWDSPVIINALTKVRACQRLESIMLAYPSIECECHQSSTISPHQARDVVKCSPMFAMALNQRAWSLLQVLLSADHRVSDQTAPLLVSVAPLDVVRLALERSESARGAFASIGRVLRADLFRLLQEKQLFTRRVILEAVSSRNWPLIVWAVRNGVSFNRSNAWRQISKVDMDPNLRSELIELLELEQHSE